MNLTRKQLALIAAACAGVVVLGVFLPWATVKASSIPGWENLPPELRAAAERNVSKQGSPNGTEGDFKGVWVLIFALAGGAAALLVHLGRTNVLPMQPRQYLFASVGALGLALILFLTDFFRDFGTAVSRGFGMWLCLLGLLVGGAAAFLATTKPGDAAAPATPAS